MGKNKNICMFCKHHKRDYTNIKDDLFVCANKDSYNYKDVTNSSERCPDYENFDKSGK